MAITSFIISLLNYDENIKQSNNDDIMKELDKDTNVLIDKLETEITNQNKLLMDISSKLETILGNDKSVVKEWKKLNV